MGLSTISAKIDELWITKLDSKFNALAIGPVFRDSDVMLVTGGEDGCVRTYNIPETISSDSLARQEIKLECRACLESKGGPIQTLTIHDVTRFFSNDLIVADSRGTLTVFSNGQIVSRQVVSDCALRCLLVEHDATGNMAIISTDTNGGIVATLPNVILWRLRLGDFPRIRGLSASVKTLVSVTLPNASGSLTDYVLASDDEGHLFVLQRGSIVMMIDTPEVITAMCVGRFVLDRAQSGGDNGHDSSNTPHQVALGGEQGAVYIFNNFQIYQDEYSNAHLPICHLCALPSSEGHDRVDSLLVAGHFNALMVFNDSKLVGRHTTPDWVDSILTTTTASSSNLNNRNNEVVIGCLDNSVVKLKIQVS